MDRCSDNNCQLKTKFESPCGTAPGCEEKVDALQADEEGETEGQEQGETECTNVLYRVHTGVTLVSEQEISLDLDQDQDQDQDRGSEKDTTDAVTVTEQSKLFSFSFYPALAPSPFKGENGEIYRTAPSYSTVVQPILHLLRFLLRHETPSYLSVIRIYEVTIHLFTTLSILCLSRPMHSFKSSNLLFADVGPAAAAVVAVLISSRAASTSSLVVLQSTGRST